MITLDTSAVIALLDRREARHEVIRAALLADPGPWLVPAATLGEISYFLEHRGGAEAMAGFALDLADNRFSLECGERSDLHRAVELRRRYADLELGFIDAMVIACAERNGGVVMSLDRRDFDVVGREGTIHLVP